MPTPVLSPWNGGSGFGAKDKEPLRRLGMPPRRTSPRLASLRAAIDVAEDGGQHARAKRLDHRAGVADKAASSWSSATGARTSCCRGSTRRSCSPTTRRSSRRSSEPAGTTGGWSSPPTSTSSSSTSWAAPTRTRRAGHVGRPRPARGHAGRSACRTCPSASSTRATPEAPGRPGSARRTRSPTRGATSSSSKARCCSPPAPPAATSTRRAGPRCRSP